MGKIKENTVSVRIIKRGLYSYSKGHGSYLQTFYKLKTFLSATHSGLDMNLYYDLPLYVCASEIY